VVTGCQSSFALLAIILLASGLLLLLPAAAFADPLQNAYRQRIGNYDVEMTTEPKSPVVGAPASILIRIAGVNGDDLIDIPIRIALAKLGGDTVQEIARTDPIVVPYGHYTYDYTFSEPGRYVLYVYLNDYAYSGQTLQFTFFVNVTGPFDYYLYVAVPAALGVAAAGAGAAFFMKRKKRQMESLK
jgi:hypothetical protein